MTPKQSRTSTYKAMGVETVEGNDEHRDARASRTQLGQGIRAEAGADAQR